MRKIVAMKQDGTVVMQGISADLTLEELTATYNEMIGLDESRYAFVNMMQQDDKGRWYVLKYKHQIS